MTAPEHSGSGQRQPAKAVAPRPSPHPPVPPNRVSRNVKMVGECKKAVKMPIVRYEDGSITITCGWFKVHNRVKVLEDAAQRHLDKKHGGQGLWL